MADFAAVLKKTIDGLGETTPEMRARVYDKARKTIAAKLAAIKPAPPAAVAERQKQTLEDAIVRIEADFAAQSVEPEKPETSDPLMELESVFASLKGKPEASVAETPASRSSGDTASEADRGSEQAEPNAEASVEDVVGEGGGPQPEVDDAGETRTRNEVMGAPPARRRNLTGLVAAVIAFVVLAGGAYAVWLNKEEFAGIFGPGDSEVVVTPQAPEAATPDQTAAEPDAGSTATQPDAEASDASDAGDAVVKFTQRLNADGTEVDEGPAGGETGVGEGTSVAGLTQPPVAAPQSTPDASGTSDAEAGAAAEGSEPASNDAQEPAAQVAVGQKAIYYEERTNSEPGSAEQGTVVWSEVQESPGGDLPPEPAIRGETTIPGKDLQLRMTIRRNGDKTLPASHIIELIFLTPDNFAGGGIDNILRFALKDTEESAGSPLIGIPAKIADGFFLVALNDSKAEIEANMTLLRRQNWIDVPVVYKSGRRALVTMEKGVPGDKVFDEVIKAWDNASSG